MSQVTRKTIKRVSSQSLLNRIQNLIKSNDKRNDRNLIQNENERRVYLPFQPSSRTRVLRFDDMEKCTLEKLRRKIWGSTLKNKSDTLTTYM